eukprot:417514-Rhodomonas_salina.1
MSLCSANTLPFVLSSSADALPNLAQLRSLEICERKEHEQAPGNYRHLHTRPVDDAWYSHGGHVLVPGAVVDEIKENVRASSK